MGQTSTFSEKENINVEKLLDSCSRVRQSLIPLNQKCAFLILDCETSGLSATKDVPYEVAGLFATCENGVVQAHHAYHSYMDWTRDGIMDEASYSAKMNATAIAMSERDPNVKRPTVQQLKAVGKHPREALQDLKNQAQNFFDYYSSQPDWMLFTCGHNIFSFDANVLHHNCTKVGVQSPVYRNLIDTGLILKAAQLNPTSLPQMIKSGGVVDTVDWVMQMGRMKIKGVFWNLSNFCTPLFNLDAHLPSYIREAPHTALTDTWKVFTLFKFFTQGRIA